jgi:hypothetical protein
VGRREDALAPAGEAAGAFRLLAEANPGPYPPDLAYVGADIASFANPQNMASFYTTDLTGVVTTLRTRPVEFSSYFPGSVSGTSHQNQLVVGDFANYLIASRAATG